jgi:hypothetical protein
VLDLTTLEGYSQKSEELALVWPGGDATLNLRARDEALATKWVAEVKTIAPSAKEVAHSNTPPPAPMLADAALKV